MMVVSSMAFVSVLADGSDAASSGTCGDGLVWDLDDNGNLTISGNGSMFDYSHKGGPWGNGVKSIRFEGSVTGIGEWAFYDCKSLASVTIPDSVTDIGYRAFFCCDSLASITVSSGNENYSSDDGILFNKNKTTLIAYPSSKLGVEYAVPDYVEAVDDDAFRHCKLQYVFLPESVKSVGAEAFGGCKSLVSVTIIGPVKVILDLTFAHCTNLRYVFLPDSVKYIGSGAFSDCFNLEYINIPASIKYIDEYAFELTQYSMYDPGELEGIGKVPGAYLRARDGVFYHQSYTLEYYVSANGREATVTGFRGTADNVTILPIYYGYKITAIADRAFYGCEDLKSISIPSSVRTIGNYAFYKCESLKSAGLGSVESVGLKSFSYCQSLRSIDIPTTIEKIGGYAFYGSGLESLKIPGNTTVGKGAFSECKDLKTVSFAGHGSTIGTRAFYNDRSLSSLDLSGASSIGVKAFPYCNGLVSVVVPGDVAAIEGYAFFSCANLKEITINDGVRKIGRSAFSGCRSMEMADLPETLDLIGPNAFYGVRFLDLDGKVMKTTSELRGHTYFGSGRVLLMTDDIENGEIFSADGIVYSVSSVDSRTVTVIGYEENAVALPSLVTYKGWPLKVTAVAAKALYKCSTLKSADLVNVSSIEMKAFANHGAVDL